MRFLVTGGAGYIGSQVVAELVDSGHDVTVIDNLSNGTPLNILSSVEFVEGDVRDDDAWEQAIAKGTPEAVIHMAASIVVAESVDKPLDYYDNNVMGCLATLRAMLKHGVQHIIFSSTAAVYGASQTMPIDESAVTAPISPYGHSKLMCEQIIQDTALAHGLKYGILRYFNVAGADPLGRVGPRSKKEPTHLMACIVDALHGKTKLLQVYGTDYSTPDGTPVRDFIHVRDLAMAHLSMLRFLMGGGGSQILNCGYGRGFSVLDVIKKFESVTGKSVPTVLASRRQSDLPEVVARTDKIKAILGWKPELDDLEKIVQSVWDWSNRDENHTVDA